MKSFEISVVIPSFKPQEYIWDCLASLVRQTIPKNKYEVIIVLNGCNYPYQTAILEYIDNNKGINWKLIQTDIPGVSNARNIGIDASNGKYIAFIDDDDYVSSSYLEELYNLSDKNTMALSYQLAFKDGKDRKYPYYITKEYENNYNKGVLPYYRCRRLFNGPVYKLIPRDIIGDRRFDVKLKNGEDSVFMFLISDKLKNVVFTSKKAIYYRRFRQGSAVSNRGNWMKRMRNASTLSKKFIHIYLKRPTKYNVFFMLSRVFGTLKTVV